MSASPPPHRRCYISGSDLLLRQAVTVPDLVADFLLVLFPVANAAAAEEDDGDDDEEEEDEDHGHGDDARSVGSCGGGEAGSVVSAVPAATGNYSISSKSLESTDDRQR